MKKLTLIFGVLIWSVSSYAANMTLPYTDHFANFNNWTYDGKVPSGADLSITTDASSPDSSSSVGAFRFPSGWADGYAPQTTYLSFAGQSELYIQYYFKYSSNFTHHPVEDKQFFLWSSSSNDNFYGAWGLFGNEFTLDLQAAGGTSGVGRLLSTSGANLQNNRWYKLTVHVKINTGSNTNGLAQVWLDDVLVINRNDVRFWNNATTFAPFSFCPVWGGYQGDTVPSTQYLYVDSLTISTTPIGTLPAPAPQLKPVPPSGLSIQ